MNKWLAHHGIKGQKWGVRNGPPYPIEDKVLKKGTRINSVSGEYLDSKKYQNNGRWMYTYRADDEWDKKVYEGPFSYYLAAHRGAKFVRRHQFEVVKDLKMPTKKERVDKFKDIYSGDRTHKDAVSEMKNIRKILLDNKAGSEEERERYSKIDLDNVQSEEDWNTAYELFNYAMEASYRFKTTREYVKEISKNFDAMVDDHNQGRYNNAHDPIIIFRANKVLKDVGGTNVSDITKGLLTWQEIESNYFKVKKELKKEGKKVRL